MKIFKSLKIYKYFFASVAILLSMSFGDTNKVFAASQDLSLSPATQNIVSGSSGTLTLGYDVSDNDNTLSGIGVQIYFDSSKLTFGGFSSVWATDKMVEEGTPQNDTGNDDSDATTDKYVSLAWANFSSSFPNTTIPLNLGILSFTAIDTTGGDTPVNIYIISKDVGYTTTITNATITIVPTHTLTMAVSPASSGTTSPTGVSTLAEGSQSISATPASGYYFVNWTSSPTGASFTSSTSASTTVNLSQDYTVTANFALLPVAGFTPSATTITRNGSVTFTNTSTDATSYSWDFGDGGTSTATSPSHQYTTAGTYTVTLTATNSGGSDVQTASITVNPIQYSLTMAVAPTSSGTTTPTGTSTRNEGSVSITASPQSGYYFVNWTSTPTGATFGNANSASTTVTLNQNMTVTANFAALPVAGFTPSATTITRNGSVTFTNTSTDATSYSWNFGDGGTSTATSPSHQYTTAGTFTVTLTATSSGGSDVQTASITVNPIQYSLTMAVSPTSSGTTTPTGTSTRNEGSVSITATPATGYSFTNWTGGTFGNANSASTTVTLDQNMTVTANFTALAEYTLTLTASPSSGGSVSVTGSDVTPASTNVYYDGTVVTIQAVAAAGYQFDHWTGNVASTTTATTTVTMSADQTVSATFVMAQGAATPEAQSLSPTIISNDADTVVTVTGVNFEDTYTYNFYMTWVREYVPAAACETGDIELTAARISSTKFQVTVPADTTPGVYNIAVCIGGQNAIKEGNVLELRIAAPAVTNAEQDAIEDAVIAAATAVTNVASTLPSYDYTADDPVPLTSSDLTTLGLGDLVAFIDVVDFKIEVVNGVVQVTATTTEPVKPSTTGVMPIQYTLVSTVDPDATQIDANKDVEIRVTLPKGVTVSTNSGLTIPYTKAILPPAQEFVPDDIQDEFGGSAVAFSMGSAEETIYFSTPIYVDFTVTLPHNVDTPTIFLLNSTTGTLDLAGVAGVSPDGVDIEQGGTVITQSQSGSDIIYNLGILLDHMSTYIVGDNSSTSTGYDDASSIACFITSLVSGIQSIPGIITILMMIGSIIGIATWRQKKD